MEGEKEMKCLLCIHYDVLYMECQKLATRFELDKPVSVPFDWYCGDYLNATSENIIEDYEKELKIGIGVTI
jgi:hypothetical protein